MMNKDALKKAFLHGIPAGAVAWFFYGLVTSLFDDDSIFELMFESSGILFAVCMTAIAVILGYQNMTKRKNTGES